MPAEDAPWTIQRLLEWTTQFFRKHGAEQPRLDAEILLAEALACQRIELYTRFSEEPSEALRARFRQWVRRHGEGEPVAYLVGHKEFFSLKFEVSHHVLIPRPETEHLVSQAIDLLRSANSENTSLWVADVGTGCGNIATAIAVHAAKIQVVATDVSQPALEIAARNAQRHGVGGSIRFVLSDLLQAVSQPEQFHLIVSNPPYVGLDEKEQLDRSVVDFEPAQALFSGGPTGVEVIQRLIAVSATRLVEGGHLVFEMSPMIAGTCQTLVENSPLSLVRVVKDLAGLERLVVARNE